MAMFLFPHNGLVLLLIGYILAILQNGLITNSITVDAMVVYNGGNKVIPGNFLQIQRPPVTRLLISQPHVPHYLPCSASINYDPDENGVSIEEFLYVWYRDGNELKTFDSSSRREFQIFPNGTLRLPTTENATGVYRCLVNYGNHGLLSESCSVEYPVLKRDKIQSNITAIRGMPITLSCPVISIPIANVSWTVNNTSVDRKLKQIRFTTLTNGSLVLKNITDNDRGKYKCTANNSYAVKKHRQFLLTVHVVSPKVTNNLYSSSLKYKLLPPLQDEVHYIPSNTDLQLRCIGRSNSITIEWWFRKTLDAQAEKISNNSMDFYIREASVKKDDGFYMCTTKEDSQVFQVIVTDPPSIMQPLQSYETQLVAFVNYSCTAEGNPSPEFSWYHNGKPLNGDSYTINIQKNVLTIQSFDLANEGVYQCFARNIAGETYSAGLLRLANRDNFDDMPKPLRNVHCYALNYNTINVTFHSGTSALYFISVHFVQKNPYTWESKPLQQLNHTKYVVISGHMPIYKPFVILIRTLLPISFNRYSHKATVEETMKSSLLSDAAHCCTQGLPIRAFHLSTDVFIMWSNPALKIKYFIIQFSVAFTRPHPQELFKASTLQGISSAITVLKFPDDIENNLQEVIPLSESQARNVLSKVQSIRNKSEDYDQDEEVFSLVIPSNVTGILLRNCLRAKIRVLIVTKENEDLQQDFRYVQWKIIENDIEEAATVPFKVFNVEPRSISFIFADSFDVQCVQICYFFYEMPDLGSSKRICHNVTMTSSKLVLKQLKPKKHYKALFYSCSGYNFFGEIDVQTLPDPPGTISNQKVTIQDGLKLSWEPPTNPNGKIHHYNILWTVNNTTHEANVSSSYTYFKFPNITEREKINVTVRVVGENGIGAPIYIDLRNIRHEHLEIEKTSIMDAYWGVAIGAALSTLCILIFCLIFIYQRHRFKIRSGQTQLTSQSESNIGAVSTPDVGGGTETTGLAGFLGDSGGGLSGRLGESSTINEYHEMQTLIPKSQQFQILKDLSGPAVPKQLPNGNGNCQRRSENSSECIFVETELNEEPIALCSSTPLPIRPPPSRNNDNEHRLYFIPVAAKNHRRDIAVDYPQSPPTLPSQSNRFTLNKISSSPNFFNGGSSSASGGCRPLALTEDCSRQRHNNRHSQRQPASMRNGCFHYVNTANNRNSYSSSSNNSKVQLPPLTHPSHQLNHSIDNGVASLSEPKLFAINNGEENADSKNHKLSQDTPEAFDNTLLHQTHVPTVDRNDGNLRIFNTTPAAVTNNNNTLSWHNKQPPTDDLMVSSQLHPHQNSSTAPLIENNSTIGFEASSSVATAPAAAVTKVTDNHPSSSGHNISSNHPNPPSHHTQEADNSTNPLLKTNWSHRRPNVDPNG